jgi:predicted component of type VI protein secretion system
MARGWESKAVEEQQLASEARKVVASAAVEEPGRHAERQALLLARARALADLQVACRPAHRAMLEQAIATLDAKLSALH